MTTTRRTLLWIVLATGVLVVFLLIQEESWFNGSSIRAIKTTIARPKPLVHMTTLELRRIQRQQVHDYLAADKYTSPLQQYPSLHASAPLPPPLQAMHDYIRQHNVDVVLSELDHPQSRPLSHQRLYTVVYFSCPHSSGNWLHNFVATVNWAMLMNRTLVYKYMDANECNALRNSMEWKFELQRCRPPAANRMEDCVPKLLTQASWMPSYDQVGRRLQWNQRSLTRLPRLATTDYVERQQRSKTTPIALDNYTYYSQFPLVAMYPWLKRLSHLYEQPAARKQQIMHQSTLDYLDHELYAWGLPFYNGMVLRSMFDFAPAMKQEVQRMLDQQSPTTGSDDSESFSVVLHSRHAALREAGCFMEREQACLEAILQRQRKVESNVASSGCSVTILSDRFCTINNLKAWLKYRHGGSCRVITADHGAIRSANSSSYNYDVFLTEHGPFSADGSFFIDVLLASLTARHGMIGELEPREGNRWRTSSELIEDFVAYSRMMEYWQESMIDGGNDAVDGSLPDFMECTLPKTAPPVSRSQEIINLVPEVRRDGPLKVTIL